MGVIIRNGIEYSGAGMGGGGSASDIMYLTQAEYDTLPESKLTDGVEYRITDAGTMAGAENIGYDNSKSGLEVVNVQDAIDKITSGMSDKMVFVDVDNVIESQSFGGNTTAVTTGTCYTYTATQDCFLSALIVVNTNYTATPQTAKINDKILFSTGGATLSSSNTYVPIYAFLKKDDVITFNCRNITSIHVCGLKSKNVETTENNDMFKYATFNVIGNSKLNAGIGESIEITDFAIPDGYTPFSISSISSERRCMTSVAVEDGVYKVRFHNVSTSAFTNIVTATVNIIYVKNTLLN